MRNLILAVLLTFLMLIVTAPDPQTPRYRFHRGEPWNFHLGAEQSLGVGVGLVGGALGFFALLHTPTAAVAGAIYGGLVGNWWSDRRPVNQHGAPVLPPAPQ